MSAAMRLCTPRTIAEAVAFLAAEPGARCIAGGSTLVAMMNASLVENIPLLVDLKKIDTLRGIERRPDGSVRIGAMTTHREIAQSELLKNGQRIVCESAATANRVIRNMGTIGGSVAFADPAADYLPCLAVADAVVEISGAVGHRLVRVADYCIDWYTTVLGRDEVLSAIHVPPAPEGTIGYYRKFARTGGDYATVAVAIVLGMEAGKVREIRCAVGACGPAPVRLTAVEAMLQGSALEPDRVAAAGALLVAACDPVDDARGSAEYRRRIVPRLLSSALAEAQLRAADRSLGNTP